MLKAIELIGFKSFADRTRFEFPSGITVVVGPNGSGKSNVVDAIKWVLGEQRVKSLRGTEMADVIFNGSGTRRPLNSAEITLTLDNSSGLLAIDTPEVHITRRVYRSGEGEYLINRQPCRLRDIRDLLSGTGMGTQAYSVIEQGRVDILLQSSPRDRRIILEEAAGISRFKAKKIEALRRLERVDQNLLRLKDLVEEVESRLRSVRLQANKARRYKQYTDRLQELRTQVGLVDWRRLGERLGQCEAEAARLTARRDGLEAEAERVEAELLELETETGDLTEAIRESEARMAGNRERIAATESSMAHERARLGDLEQEIARHRRQLASQSSRAGDLQQRLRRTGEAVRAATERHRQITRSLAEQERGLTELIGQLDRLRGEGQQRRVAYIDRMRSAAELASRITGLETRVAAAEASQERTARRRGEVEAQLARVAAEREALAAQQEELDQAAARRSQRLRHEEERIAGLRSRRDEGQGQLARLTEQASGLGERVRVLEELERRREGIAPGTRQILAQAEAASEGPVRHVLGIVAHLVRARVEVAPLVDIALGEKAQYLVATPQPELIDYVKAEAPRLGGRVGFVWITADSRSDKAPATPLDGRPGVVGRADRFVEAAPRYASVVRRLLGRVWFVESLDHALALAESAGPGSAFVTLAGERVGPDGTLAVGPSGGVAGLVSRRSELAALQSQQEDLERRIAQTRSRLAEIDAELAEREATRSRWAEAHREAVEALSRHAQKRAATEERYRQLQQQRSTLEAEWQAASEEHQDASSRLAEAQDQQKTMQSTLMEMDRGLSELNQQIERLEAERQAQGRRATEAKVELAKSEERLGNLRAQMRQFAQAQREGQRVISEGRQRLDECLRRAQACRGNILRAESEIAELYLRKEALHAETVKAVNRREQCREARSRTANQLAQLRSQVREQEEQLHAQQLVAAQLRQERTALVERLREDYGIDLAAVQQEVVDPTHQQQPEAVQEEIDDLRRKINNIGNVNLEALEELDQLEARHGHLAGQYEDLCRAKNSLQRIIDKINADSRRLFSETLETVRGHFGTLFRDLFGGGRADIVLEEDVDILESGIEIVARPPGKEPRSISLLSGGEKTLTCVALLLAIFRSRPSPFCVLDEVDAALDEANIDRFTNVLRGFLAWTQFIIVTHSKKTMTCANTIYGVTMQESGVSKQVSVRFEDVSETGEILTPPVEADADAGEGSAEDGHQAA